MPLSIERDPKMKRGPHPQAVELLHRRAACGKHFRNPDGSHTAVFATGPMHYQDAAGDWQDIDLSFRQAGADYISDRNIVHVVVRGAGVEIRESRTGDGIRWILPGAPAVNAQAVRFTDQGLDWQYALRTQGLKLSASVVAPRGAQIYAFRCQFIGGAGAWTDDGDGGLTFGAFRVPRAYATDADGLRYDCGAWRQLPGNRVAFDWDDSVVPLTAYPYILDPTTFTVGADADDGYVWGGPAAYPPSAAGANTTATTINVEKFPAYYIYVGLTRWDTSSLPDTAVVSAATARLYGDLINNLDSRNLTADWYDAGTIGTEDYTSTVGTNAHAGTSLSSLITGGYNSVALTNVNNVSTTGYTGLRWHISGEAPTDTNTFRFYSFAQGAGYRPELVVTYNTPPNSPTGTFPTGSVAGNTNITAEGTDSEAGDTLQFEWDLSSNSGGAWTTIPAGNLSPAANPTAAVAQSTPQTIALITTAYADATTYRLRVRAYDGSAYGAYDTQGADFTINNSKRFQMMI